MVADYASTGVTMGTHPMELMRPALGEGVSLSSELERMQDGSAVDVAGMVVARQRPATARGVVFMLLEDESGVVNIVVLPPAFERYRLVARTAAFVRIAGRLERREGVINVVANRLEPLAAPDADLGAVTSIERPDEPAQDVVELEAVAPRAHSFGRRG
jgi:error-prone DNA polymerase